MKDSPNIKNPFLIGTTAVLLASIFTYVGAAFAKQLFPVIGAYGVTALRTANLLNPIGFRIIGSTDIFY